MTSMSITVREFAVEFLGDDEATPRPPIRPKGCSRGHPPKANS